MWTRPSRGPTSTRPAPAGIPTRSPSHPAGSRPSPPAMRWGAPAAGWTTKTHLACEQGRKPLSIVVTAGQCGDSPQFTAVVEAISVPRPGPPRNRPDCVLADKALQQRREPHLPAHTRDPRDHPDQGRPGSQPEEEGLVRWAAASVRRRALQAAPCSRVRYQPTQAEPCCGNQTTSLRFATPLQSASPPSTSGSAPLTSETRPSDSPRICDPTC